MPKVVLSNVSSGYGTVDVLNANFDAIEAAFDNTLSRDGDSPNPMLANLDMNNFNILNAESINGVSKEALEELGDLSAFIAEAEQSADNAAVSATSAGTSATNASNSASAASASASAAAISAGVAAAPWVVNGSNISYTTGGTSVASLNGGQLAGVRNKIINGKMEIAQRRTSFTLSANNSRDYTIDRWYFLNMGTSIVTSVTQSSDFPAGTNLQSSIRATTTTADTTIHSNDLATIGQCIEGYGVRDLIGIPFTLSFWVRSSKTGVHCVAFSNSSSLITSDRSYIVSYSIASGNTWEFKTITVPGGLVTAGTWNWADASGLRVDFVLAAGTNYHDSAGAWVTNSGKYATSNQVNCVDTVGNIFAITGVQLEVGAIATPFEQRPRGLELMLCQRYFEKSYPEGIAPGAIGVNGYAELIVRTTSSIMSVGSVQAKFCVPKRAIPTVTTYSSFTGASGKVLDNFNGVDITPSSVSVGATGFSAEATISTSNSLILKAHWTASAEL